MSLRIEKSASIGGSGLLERYYPPRACIWEMQRDRRMVGASEQELASEVDGRINSNGHRNAFGFGMEMKWDRLFGSVSRA